MTPACKPAAKSTDFDELTAAQSAAYLGCSRATFYRAVACGWIAKSTRTFAGPRWLRYQLDEEGHPDVPILAYTRPSGSTRRRARGGRRPSRGSDPREQRRPGITPRPPPHTDPLTDRRTGEQPAADPSTAAPANRGRHGRR